MYMACMYCTCLSIPSTCMYECIIYYITQVCTPMLMYINLPSTIIENKHYLLSFICRAVRLNVAILTRKALPPLLLFSYTYSKGVDAPLLLLALICDLGGDFF
jgi:hypothetical protein